MAENLWRGYSKCWSIADAAQRIKRLGTVAENDVIYRDPYSSCSGIDELSEYMAGFQAGFPGAKFVIKTVQRHHDCILAHWDLVLANGHVLHDGRSFAKLGPQGKLQDITGFFDVAKQD